MLLFDRRSLHGAVVVAAAGVCSLVLEDTSPTTTTTKSYLFDILTVPQGQTNEVLASLSSSMDDTFPIAATATTTTQRIVDCICSFTPQSYRKEVQRSSGKFLYRGEDLKVSVGITATSTAIVKKILQASKTKDTDDHVDRSLLMNLGNWIQNPTPDLLLPETYDNPMAVSYFECLEKRIRTSMDVSTAISRPSSKPTITAKPSNGHIGTSDPEQAGRWGEIVSVWPMGDNLSYVWMRDQAEFFPTTVDVGDNKKSSCHYDRLVIDRHLAWALQRNHEVLFCSWFDDDERRPSSSTFSSSSIQPVSAYLTVPIQYDGILRHSLRKVNYGL